MGKLRITVGAYGARNIVALVGGNTYEKTCAKWTLTPPDVLAISLGVELNLNLFSCECKWMQYARCRQLL